MSAFGNRPLAYVCYLCGQQYGSKSLLIHVPQCAAKWCQQHQTAVPPTPPQQLPATADQLPHGRAAVEAFNAAMMDYWQQAALERCPHCNRTFRLEAVPGHKKVCSAAKTFKPLPGQLAQASTAHSSSSSSNDSKAGSRSIKTGSKKSGTSNTISGSGSTSQCGFDGSATGATAAGATSAGGGFGRVGKMPQGLVCYLCGGQFFPRSLPIHLPQCQIKWQQQQQLSSSTTPAAAAAVPPPPAAVAAMLDGSVPLPTTTEAVQAFNAAAFAAFNSSSLVPCKACGRTFRPEALVHHAKHCTADKPMKR